MIDFWDRLVQYALPDGQYYKSEYGKKQIVLHHTVSGGNAKGDIHWWKTDPKPIGTFAVIDRDGTIYQCFPSKYWAHHLGIRTDTFKAFDLPNINNRLNQQSIGIELDSWGPLMKVGEEYFNVKWDTSARKFVANQKVKPESVSYYFDPVRGFNYYEDYTKAQLESLESLLVYLCDKYNIPSIYDESMWVTNNKALTGHPGIWTHVSYRFDKSDCHPQEELVNILSNLPNTIKGIKEDKRLGDEHSTN